MGKELSVQETEHGLLIKTEIEPRVMVGGEYVFDTDTHRACFYRCKKVAPDTYSATADQLRPGDASFGEYGWMAEFPEVTTAREEMQGRSLYED